MPSKTLFVRTAFVGAVLFLGSIAAATGVAGHSAVTSGHQTNATPWGAPGDPSKVTRTVTIIATEIKFNVSQLTFRQGDTVKFVFVNKGVQPHELMIADHAEQVEHRRLMAEMAGMTMPAGSHPAEGNVVDAKPGETKVLIWSFTKKGKFEFGCNYVGHAESGMIGTITVR
jgi:uncharacterized cupredoxin-like copper-binding protein